MAVWRLPASLPACLLLAICIATSTSSATTPPRRLLGNSFAAPGNASYEYIVVGAGNAGLPLAVRLAQGGRSVAVIEGGSFYEIGNGNYSQIPGLAPAFTGKNIQDVSPQVDWQFQTTPQAGQFGETPLYPRGKTLGGSSARNYLAYHRPTIGSMQQWADAVGDSSYQWDNVLPYYEKSLNFTPPSPLRPANDTPKYDASTLGDGSGPLQVGWGTFAWPLESWGKRALAEVGIPERDGFTSGALFGSSNQLLCLDQTTFTRDSSETSFLRKIGLQSPNLIVYPNTLATRVLFDCNKKAVGVSIDFGGRTYTLNATKEVIVSAGVFQSPQLLMVSGVGPKANLEAHGISVVADRPGVGQNLWDHTLGGPTWEVSVETSDNLADPAFLEKTIDQYNSYPPQGPYTTINGDLIAFEKLPHKYRSMLSNRTLAGLSKFAADWPEVEYLVISAYGGPSESYLGGAPDSKSYASIQAALVSPFSRGNVTIKSADMHDHPVINPNWLTDPRDQEVAVASYHRVRDIFNATAIRPILVGSERYPGLNVSTNDQILDIIKQSYGSVYHAACTCKMGKRNDTMSVIDSEAKVIGVDGLRVVDISSFPLLPPGHPMSTVYMLAEKIAAEILKGAR